MMNDRRVPPADSGRVVRGYGASLVVAGSGAALLLFGILASTDAATVGGVTFGAAILGAGSLLAVDTARERRDVRATLSLSDHALRRIQRSEDRSTEPPVAAREWPGWDPDDPEDPSR